MVSIVTAVVFRSNPPLEWTGHHQCLASPPPAPCLPLRSSVREMGGQFAVDKSGIVRV